MSRHADVVVNRSGAPRPARLRPAVPPLQRAIALFQAASHAPVGRKAPAGRARATPFAVLLALTPHAAMALAVRQVVVRAMCLGRLLRRLRLIGRGRRVRGARLGVRGLMGDR
jgi:hypothetical protein